MDDLESTGLIVVGMMMMLMLVVLVLVVIDVGRRRVVLRDEWNWRIVAGVRRLRIMLQRKEASSV